MKISAELNFPADYSGNVSDKYVKEKIASLIAEKISAELLKHDAIEFKHRLDDKYYTVKGTVDFYCENDQLTYCIQSGIICK